MLTAPVKVPELEACLRLSKQLRLESFPLRRPRRRAPTTRSTMCVHSLPGTITATPRGWMLTILVQPVALLAGLHLYLSDHCASQPVCVP